MKHNLIPSNSIFVGTTFLIFCTKGITCLSGLKALTSETGIKRLKDSSRRSRFILICRPSWSSRSFCLLTLHACDMKRRGTSRTPFVAFLLLALSCHTSQSVPLPDFFPYGQENSDATLSPESEGLSFPLRLNSIRFGKSHYDKIYLSAHGTIYIGTGKHTFWKNYIFVGLYYKVSLKFPLKEQTVLYHLVDPTQDQ